jgi:L-lactate dehydrogenase complex protein LldG
MGAPNRTHQVSARDSILAAIRRAAVPASPPTSSVVRAAPIEPPVEQFLRLQPMVGGAGTRLAAGQSLESVLNGLFPLTREDVLVVVGRFAVAENGAVYVDANDLSDRAEIVRTEHLVLTVSAQAIVPTMHEAISLMPSGSACGWFLSGPSKTADIEQSLVIGAQGARSLHVIVHD